MLASRAAAEPLPRPLRRAQRAAGPRGGAGQARTPQVAAARARQGVGRLETQLLEPENLGFFEYFMIFWMLRGFKPCSERRGVWTGFKQV